ncbi:MAG: N-acetylmuramoyl-L-alanine amidase [Bacteroidales bacterium]|nr:N-acetylmuramoyl-L-alanine amidase [Candidatus Cacconaster equifaecalis]
MKRCFAFSIIVPLLLMGTVAYAETDSSVKLRTVVIDAGHGGNDPGTISPDKKLKESSINLDIALALGKKIDEAFPDVKVLYTRKKDVFIPLATRADIANRNHADLFISIHVNSVKNKSDVRGVETFVMGTDKSASNMEVCKRENSVILLEKDYSTTYQGFDPSNAESYILFNLMQNASFEQSIEMASLVQKQLKKGPITVNRGIKQAPILVLWKTTMPAILVEVGFLSNPSDRRILASKAERDKIADNIFKAFRAFKDGYDEDISFVDESETDIPEPQVEVAAAKPDGKAYRIQIMASPKNLSEGNSQFKGLKDVDKLRVNGLYKYTVGSYASREEASAALKTVKAKFPEAFIVYR